MSDDDFALALGRRVSQARKRANLTVAELAGRCGMTRNSLTNLEKGRHSTSVQRLRRIAAALGTDVSALIGETQHQPPDAVKLVADDWDKVGESEAQFYRRALSEILAWQTLAVRPNPWPGNVWYGLATCTRIAGSALRGVEFNVERQLEELHRLMAQDEAPEAQLREGDSDGA